MRETETEHIFIGIYTADNGNSTQLNSTRKQTDRQTDSLDEVHTNQKGGEFLQSNSTII